MALNALRLWLEAKEGADCLTSSCSRLEMEEHQFSESELVLVSICSVEMRVQEGLREWDHQPVVTTSCPGRKCHELPATASRPEQQGPVPYERIRSHSFATDLMSKAT